MGPQPEILNGNDVSSNLEWSQQVSQAQLVIDRRNTKLGREILDNMMRSTCIEDLTEFDNLHNSLENDIDFDLPDLIKDSSATIGMDILSDQQTSLLPQQGTHFIVEACVSGFVPVKRKLSEVKDMAYVIEVSWSDGRTHMVKRTFTDFCHFHTYLLDEWRTVNYKDGPLRLTFYLPERQTGESETSIELAECRELQLNKYVQELIKLPQQISASPTVLTFFESRGTDPKPYRETVSPSQTEVADQYVLCWI